MAETLAEKFHRIEPNFNHSFLQALNQILSIPEGEPDEENKHQFQILSQAYNYWYELIDSNEYSTAACTSFYDAIGDNHELLTSKSEDVFEVKGKDLLSQIFAAEGVRTRFLYDQLRDGTEPDSEQIPEDERDAKLIFWNTLIGLYRFCALICIYLKMPLVKEIVDLILVNNPNLHQQNILGTIFTEFTQGKRLRKLMIKLMKTKEDSFADIFTSLQKVLCTFSTEMNMSNLSNLNPTASMEAAQKQIRKGFESVLIQQDVKLDDSQITTLMTALDNNDEDTLEQMLENHLLTEAQFEAIRDHHKAQTQNRKTVQTLGDTMKTMMKAFESNDENALQNVLQEAGTNLNIDPAQLKTIHQEMESFEKKLEKGEEEEEGDLD